MGIQLGLRLEENVGGAERGVSVRSRRTNVVGHNRGWSADGVQHGRGHFGGKFLGFTCGVECSGDQNGWQYIYICT